MTKRLEQYTIHVPPVPITPWKDELRQASSATKILLLQQVRLLSLPADIPERTPATPERIGWVAAWAKAIRTIDAARACADRKNDVALVMLGRTLFEISLHMMAVLRPVLSWGKLKESGIRVIGNPAVDSEHWAEAADRLCAYTTWCLDGDLELIEHELRPDVVRAVFDSVPAQELASDPEQKALHEALFGHLEVPGREDLGRDKANWIRKGQERRRRILTWFEHPHLRSWHQKLLSQKSRAKPGQTPTFFELVDEDESSVAAQLRSRNLSFTYLQYKHGSLLVHGSSVQEVVHVGREVLVPTVISLDDDDVANSAAPLGISGTQIWLALSLLRPYVWGNGDAAPSPSS